MLSTEQMKSLNALRKIYKTDSFKEEEHPRGQPENSGQFAPKNGVISTSSVDKAKSILKSLSIRGSDILSVASEAVDVLQRRKVEEMSDARKGFVISPKKMKEQNEKARAIAQEYNEKIETINDVVERLEDGMDEVLESIFDNASEVFDDESLIVDDEITDEGVLKYGNEIIKQLTEFGICGGEAYRKSLFQIEQACGKNYEVVYAKNRPKKKSAIGRPTMLSHQESESKFSDSIIKIKGISQSAKRVMQETFTKIKDDRFKSVFAHIISNCEVRGGNRSCSDGGSKKVTLCEKDFKGNAGGVLIHELGHKMEEYLPSKDGLDLCSVITTSGCIKKDAEFLRSKLLKMCGKEDDGEEYNESLQGLLKDDEPFEPDTEETSSKFNAMLRQLRKGEVSIPVNGKRKKIRPLTEFEVSIIADMVQAVTCYTVVDDSFGHKKPYFYNSKASETELIANYSTVFLEGGDDMREVIRYLIPDTEAVLNALYEDVLDNCLDR